MQEEIEKIVGCDESGRKTIQNAKEHANNLLAEAKEEVEKKKDAMSQELDRFRKENVAKIVEDAERDAEKIVQDAKDYCKDLNKRFESIEEEMTAKVGALIRGEIGME